MPHAADWTYSLAIPRAHGWYELPAIESYRRIHDWIRVSLLEVALPSELARENAGAAPGQCFSGHSRFDVLWRGQKVAGAAQRRRRDGLLIQGSLQPEGLAVERGSWQRAFLVVGEREGINWVPFDADALTSRVNELVGRKYSQIGYNQKR